MDDVTVALEKHQGVLEAYCGLFCRDPHDRDELAQLVRIRVWRGYATFDRRAAFSTWLYRIVRNTAATEYARRARLAVPIDLGDGGEHLAAAPGDGPEDVVVRRDELDRALQRVDERFGRSVVLVDLWGCGQAEVARITGVAPATARTRLFRGRRQLRRALAASAP